MLQGSTAMSLLSFVVNRTGKRSNETVWCGKISTTSGAKYLSPDTQDLKPLTASSLETPYLVLE